MWDTRLAGRGRLRDLPRCVLLLSEAVMYSLIMLDRHAREQLRAMRHLPASTTLPRPATIEEQWLLDELLRQPDHISPLHWIGQHAGDVASRVTLLHAIVSIEGVAYGVQRARAAGWVIPEFEQALLGDLIGGENKGDQTLTKQGPLLEHDVVVEQFQQLRRRRGKVYEVIPTAPNERQQLFVDILQLGDGVDALEWLQRNRSKICARVALMHILEQCSPSRRQETGEQIAVLRPEAVLFVPPIASIVITEIISGTEGFSLLANVTTSADTAIAAPSDVHAVVVEWPGFDRVVDNLGQHYMLKDRRISTRWQDTLCREEITMTFYPAIAPDVEELTFTAISSFLQTIGMRPSQSPVLLQEQSYGRIVWRTKVPA